MSINRTHMFTIQSWSAWAPGLDSLESWQQWAQRNLPLGEEEGTPPVSFIPPLVKRRCSRVTRAALMVAAHCLPPSMISTVRSVFISRHGEAEITEKLLDSLHSREPLSPMAFGLSVHNASSGLFSILAKNVSFSTTLSSRGRSVTSGLVEVLGLLDEDPTVPVLLVIADEPLPVRFREVPEERYPLFAIALVCTSSGYSSPGVSASNVMLEIGSNSEHSPQSVCQEVQLLKLLTHVHPTVKFYDRGTCYTLKGEGDLSIQFRAEGSLSEKQI